MTRSYYGTPPNAASILSARPGCRLCPPRRSDAKAGRAHYFFLKNLSKSELGDGDRFAVAPPDDCAVNHFRASVMWGW